MTSCSSWRHAHQIQYEVREISEYEVRTAQEILLTSSTKEIMPITRLDGKPVGDGKPGAMFECALPALPEL